MNNQTGNMSNLTGNECQLIVQGIGQAVGAYERMHQNSSSNSSSMFSNTASSSNPTRNLQNDLNHIVSMFQGGMFSSNSECGNAKNLENQLQQAITQGMNNYGYQGTTTQMQGMQGMMGMSGTQNLQQGMQQAQLYNPNLGQGSPFQGTSFGTTSNLNNYMGIQGPARRNNVFGGGKRRRKSRQQGGRRRRRRSTRRRR